MKKNVITTAFLTAVILGSAQFATSAFADGMVYEPVFEAVPITESMNTTTTTAKPEPIAQTASTKTTTPAVTSTPAPNSVEANNLQNALMQLDGAQVEIRNQLLQYKSEYSTIDNQYRMIKEQRAQKAKQIRETEKKIKNLDSTKEKIRKNLN